MSAKNCPVFAGPFSRFRDHIQPLGFDYTYEEGPGDHNWEYWDTMIQRVLDWLPVE